MHQSNYLSRVNKAFVAERTPNEPRFQKVRVCAHSSEKNDGFEAQSDVILPYCSNQTGLPDVWPLNRAGGCPDALFRERTSRAIPLNHDNDTEVPHTEVKPVPVYWFVPSLVTLVD